MRSKLIKINDILEGFNNSTKIIKIYNELREKIIKAKPIYISNRNLVITPDYDWRTGNYWVEIYNKEGTLFILEFFGSWTGYRHESRQPPSLEDSILSELRIKICPPNKSIEEKIRSIIARFPEK